MGKLIKREVLEDFRWHDLRHCSASYMRQDGLSLGHIGNVTLATNLRRLQIVIRTLVRKELFRLEQPYPRSCMAECRQKCIRKGGLGDTAPLSYALRTTLAIQLLGYGCTSIQISSPERCAERSVLTED